MQCLRERKKSFKAIRRVNGGLGYKGHFWVMEMFCITNGTGVLWSGPPVKTHHFRQTHILYVNYISLKLIFNAVFRDKMSEPNVEDSWILQVEVSTHETENKSS